MSLLFSATGYAESFSENFSTTTRLNSASAVWNLASQTLHPTPQVTGWRVNGGDTPTNTIIEVGDGSHGAFGPTTYTNFGTLTNGTLFVNAAQFPALRVTSFELAENDTLVAVGGPLVIYSQSTVSISGTIQCSGTDAQGQNAGQGRCGGGNGGDGGAAASSGTDGFPRSGSVRGGLGGSYLGVASGSGGGGGGSFAPSNGSAGVDSNSPPTNLGGTGGTSTIDHAFTGLGSSGGGGGGSGSNSESGGGGGGAGGTVVIHAVGDITLAATGSILARGGSGAAANSGGGGGGGAGGSVKILTPARITLAPAGTPINVAGGASGTPAVGTAGAGGSGIYGRTWLLASTFSGSGSESHPTLLSSIGTLEYTTGVSQTAESKSYDTGSNFPVFQSITSTPSSSEVSFEVAASSDDFATDDSGWISASLLASLQNRRFIKFRVAITNSNATAPTTLSLITLNFALERQKEFSFTSTSSCGSVRGAELFVKTASMPSTSAFSDMANVISIVLLLLLPLLVAIACKVLVRSRKFSHFFLEIAR